MPPSLYLIDGHALAYRTYFALTRGTPGSFTTRSGEPTAGIFGFTSVLMRILEQEEVDYLAVAFDTGRTFRDDIYPEYKGTRAKMPDDLRPQIERIRQLVDAFNIPRLEKEGYEADDVLGSVAYSAKNLGLGVKIFTGDRDLLQLVNERIIVNLPGKSLSDSSDYLPKDVKEYLGIWPEQVVDYKALVGDSSDNIPGVTGIGQKTATTLLETYENLDNIFAHINDLSPSVKKKLEDGRENAYMSQELARIVTDLDVDLDLEQARPDHFDPRVVEELFRTLEFRSLMTRLDALIEKMGLISTQPGGQLSMFTQKSLTKKTEVRISEKVSHSIVVDSPEALEELAHRLQRAEIIAIDTETTSTDQMLAELVGISLAIEPGQGYYIPVGHNTNDPQLPLDVILKHLQDPLTDKSIPKAGHNLKYDYIVLARLGLRVDPLTFDTMIAEWLINPSSRNLGLKNLAWVRQGIKMTEIEELIGKGKKQISMADVSIADTANYAAADAEIVLRLIPELTHELKERLAIDLLKDVEMPLVSVLAEMEMTGVRLDTDFLAKMSTNLGNRLDRIERDIYTKVGTTFNLNSPQQLSEALFDRMGIEPPDRSKKTATGFYSTSASVLESLHGKHEVVDDILIYRELSKLKSTYVDALPLQVNPHTGKIHTSYNQTGSVTGRIASSNPNLQNIPIRTEEGRKVRDGFIVDPGYNLLSVDYSQVELRIVAHMADDKAMIETFKSGEDIHAATAAAIYGIPLDQVSKAQRRHAKAVNFGLIYGMSAYGLTRTTDLTLAEAEDFVKTYFEQFPGVKNYLDGMRKLAADQGFVETILGRRRYFPRLKQETNYNIRNREEREAINAPIQGSAADIMKIAMLRVPVALKEAELSAQMLLQVHDELVLECPTEEIVETSKLVKEVMENAYELLVPLLTDSRYGLNWGNMKEI